MTSLWLSNRVESATPPGSIDGADVPEVVVVGAGITGLTTAVLLARAGKRVVVLEARYVGSGTTRNTTGKVSVLQGTKLSPSGRPRTTPRSTSCHTSDRSFPVPRR